MKRVTLFVCGILFYTTNTFALDIHEAIQRGIAQSHSIKASQLHEDYSKAMFEKIYSGYKPNINLSYAVSAYEETNDADSNYNSTSGSISLGYNLFNGFATKYALKSAQENINISQYKKLANIADIKLNIQLAYINYLEKRRTLVAKEEAVELLLKSLKDTQAYYDQGLLAKNSLLETKVALSNAKQDLLSAKSAKFIARETLSRLLGGKLGDDEEIQELDFEEKVLPSYEQLVAQGLKNRQEIKALQSTYKALEYTYEASKSDLYPKVNISIAHTFLNIDGDIYKDAFYYDTQNSATLAVNYNLYQGGANEAQRVAYLVQSKMANENLKDLMLDIKLQISQAKEAYELALQNQKVAIATQELASENFIIVTNRYKAQLERTTDFLDARLQLTKAKIGYANSIYNVYAKYAQLQRAIGNR